MEIATGYFAKAQAYHDLGYALVNVARKKPWFLPEGLKLHMSIFPLAPSEEILELKECPEEYTRRYREEVLSLLAPCDIELDLRAIAESDKTDKAVLLCYEAPDKLCHRHLIAQWLTEGTGTVVKEIELKKKNGDLFG